PSFFFQAEDGIRDFHVTGVQTCALPIFAQSPLPRNEVHILLAHVLQVRRTWLLAHDREPLPPAAIDEFHALERRRHRGEPIAYRSEERRVGKECGASWEAETLPQGSQPT